MHLRAPSLRGVDAYWIVDPDKSSAYGRGFEQVPIPDAL
jgi:hypothetical protein